MYKRQNVEKARYEVRLPSGEALRLKPANVQPPAHFKVLETARLMKADGTGRLPVTVLSGFLGSGKTRCSTTCSTTRTAAGSR